MKKVTDFIERKSFFFVLWDTYPCTSAHFFGLVDPLIKRITQHLDHLKGKRCDFVGFHNPIVYP